MKFRVHTLFTLITLVALITLLTACTDKAYVGEPLAEDEPAMTVSQAVDPTTFGRTIRVKGKVHRVCQDEGCWMSITDGNSYLRMTFSKPNTLVPKDLSGDVIVEGVVAEEVYDEDVAKAIGGSIGLSEEQIDRIQGDQRIPMMTSTGVLFLDHRP